MYVVLDLRPQALLNRHHMNHINTETFFSFSSKYFLSSPLTHWPLSSALLIFQIFRHFSEIVLSLSSTLLLLCSENLCVCVCQLLSGVRLFAPPGTVARQTPLSMGLSPGNTGMGCHSLLQGIVLTRGSNLRVSFIAGRFFTIWANREDQVSKMKTLIFLDMVEKKLLHHEKSDIRTNFAL